MVSLNSFTAEPEHIYYFRAQLHTDAAPLTLEPIAEDEGKRLLSQASKALSQEK